MARKANFLEIEVRETSGKIPSFSIRFYPIQGGKRVGSA